VFHVSHAEHCAVGVADLLVMKHCSITDYCYGKN